MTIHDQTVRDYLIARQNSVYTVYCIGLRELTLLTACTQAPRAFNSIVESWPQCTCTQCPTGPCRRLCVHKFVDLSHAHHAVLQSAVIPHDEKLPSGLSSLCSRSCYVFSSTQIFWFIRVASVCVIKRSELRLGYRSRMFGHADSTIRARWYTVILLAMLPFL